MSIIEYRAIDTLDVEDWRIATTPELVVGLAEGAEPYLLDHLSFPRRLSDGSIAVALEEPPEIRLFDAKGTFVRSLSRRGSGPGEVRSIAHIGVFGHDSLAAYDELQRKLVVFDSIGRFARSALLTRPEPLPEVAELPGIVFLGVFPDGSVLTTNTPGDGPGRAANGARTDFTWPLRHLPTGEIRADFGKHVAARSVLVGPGGVGSRGPSAMQMSIASAQYGLVGDRFFFLDPYTADVYQYDSSGRLRTITRLGITRRIKADLPASTFDRKTLGRGKAKGEPYNVRDAFPDTLPVSTLGSFADRAGNIWIMRPQPTTDRSSRPDQRWVVVDSTGLVRAIATRAATSGRSHIMLHIGHPVGIDNLDVSERHFVGVTVDSLDVEYVSVFPIEKRPKKRGGQE